MRACWTSAADRWNPPRNGIESPLLSTMALPSGETPADGMASTGHLPPPGLGRPEGAAAGASRLVRSLLLPRSAAPRLSLPVRRAREEPGPVLWKVDRRFFGRFLDPDAVKVVRRLSQHGYAAYLVGGCVRDLYLGRIPKDFDIATEATPRQVKRLFRNSRIIGRRFRLVHVSFGSKRLDVSTFRALSEATSEDDPMIRHDNVFGTAAEDARRRDFTINGLFFDILRGEIRDYVGGLRDLDRGVIETIGDPWTRFREDPIRMLRAIKFAGRLGFRLADDVFQAVIDCGPDIRKAAVPRIFEEIVRMLDRGGAEQSTRLLYKTGLLRILLPEVASILEHALASGRLPPLWECFAHLDELSRRGVDIPPQTMLAVLLLELFDDAVYAAADGTPLRDLPAIIEDALRPIARRLRISRRDQYVIKQILVAQRRFTGVAKARRRRGANASLLAQEHFHAAWLLFRTQSLATGRYQAQRHAWEERLQREGRM